jgi:hypothetical protein
MGKRSDRAMELAEKIIEAKKVVADLEAQFRQVVEDDAFPPVKREPQPLIAINSNNSNDSLSGQLRSWFSENRDRKVCLDEIYSAFNVDRKAIQKTVYYLKKTKKVEPTDDGALRWKGDA